MKEIMPGSKWLCIKNLVLSTGKVLYREGEICTSRYGAKIDDGKFHKHFRVVPKNKRFTARGIIQSE